MVRRPAKISQGQQRKEQNKEQSKKISPLALLLIHCFGALALDPELVSIILVMLFVFGHAKTTFLLCRGRRRVE
jgi:hypothetical protein